MRMRRAWQVMIAGSVLLALACTSGGSTPAAARQSRPQAAKAACEPLPSSLRIARASWTESDREVIVAGRSIERGDSDREFEVLEGELWLARSPGPCLLARAPLGEVTRVVSPDAGKAEPIDVPVLPVGELEGFEGSVAFERAELADGSEILIVHLMRDVKWGLTERYAVPVTLRGDELIAGDRVQVGRDALTPPVYYGEFRLEPAGAGYPLSLRRTGSGRFSKQARLALDAAGALRASEEPLPEPAEAAPTDGSTSARALRACGAESAVYVLTQEPCDDGSTPTNVQREGTAGMADDGHMIDRYRVTCGSGPDRAEKIVFVDAYHCRRDAPGR